MILLGENIKSSDEYLRRAIGVAQYYGFLPVEAVLPTCKLTRRLPATIPSSEKADKEFAAIMYSYIENGYAKLSQPSLLYHHTENPDSISFGLQVLGSNKSIAEAILLKTALAILAEADTPKTCVYINGIGDRDSMQRFSRDLTAYLRKNVEDIPAHARQLMKKDPIAAYRDMLRKRHDVALRAPNTIQFLTEASRSHLREVLEYLEVAGVPYELDTNLVGYQDCHTRTFFEIREQNENEDEEQKIFARGGRFDELGKRAFKTEVPSVNVTLTIEKKGRVSKKSLEPKPQRKPKVCFIQLGFDAKLRALNVIEELRLSKVPVYQALGHERLTDQLALAEEMHIPYAVIMGQKEALENAVIVRNLDTRSQQTVPLTMLPQHLKTL